VACRLNEPGVAIPWHHHRFRFGLMIVDRGFLISDLSLKPSARAKQAHFNNQKSTIANRQSIRRSVIPQLPDKEAASKCHLNLRLSTGAALR